jgi:hypothetical protein
MVVDAWTGHRPLSWFNSRPGLQFHHYLFYLFSIFPIAGRPAWQPNFQLRQRMLTPRQLRGAQPPTYILPAAVAKAAAK